MPNMSSLLALVGAASMWVDASGAGRAFGAPTRDARNPPPECRYAQPASSADKASPESAPKTAATAPTNRR
jgi:hypothetical protein